MPVTITTLTATWRWACPAGGACAAWRPSQRCARQRHAAPVPPNRALPLCHPIACCPCATPSRAAPVPPHRVQRDKRSATSQRLGPLEISEAAAQGVTNTLVSSHACPCAVRARNVLRPSTAISRVVCRCAEDDAMAVAMATRNDVGQLRQGARDQGARDQSSWASRSGTCCRVVRRPAATAAALSAERACGAEPEPLLTRPTTRKRAGRLLWRSEATARVHTMLLLLPRPSATNSSRRVYYIHSAREMRW
jgi:hypothetical protein